MSNVLVNPLYSNKFMASMWILANLSGQQEEITKSVIDRVYRADRRVVRPDMVSRRIRQVGVLAHERDLQKSIDMNSAVIIADTVLRVDQDHLRLRVMTAIKRVPPVESVKRFKSLSELIAYEKDAMRSASDIIKVSDIIFKSG